MSASEVALLAPEIVVALGASWLLLAPFLFRRDDVGLARWQTLLVLAVATAAILWSAEGAGANAGGLLGATFALDGFAVFFKLLFVAAVALVVLLSTDFLREEGYSPWEYFSLLAFALCGAMFMVSGVHLISIWIGLELLSLSSYVLAGYYKDRAASTEAAMKYFVLGTASSAIMLYGMSLIFGVTGSLELGRVAVAVVGAAGSDALAFGTLLLGAGLCFKVAAVPFHVWTPDVYVGAPTPVTAFLATASKAAAFAIFARIFYQGFAGLRVEWSGVLAVVAALSMVGGNLAAITQDNVKRMLAWSSIGHAGYALIGILAMTPLGLTSVLVYMLVYVFATAGIWAVILMLRRKEYAGESVADFGGLHARAPLVAFAMVVFLLSLGGIPPTAGFVGKYYLFLAGVGAGWGWLVVLAVLTSALSMFYYFRLVVAMYLREERGAEIAGGGALKLVAAVCLVVVLALGVMPQPLLERVAVALAGS
ncbi:MAG: NADH-quinone oxidoreductase subunit N [Thermoanaerobaculia bacterium]